MGGTDADAGNAHSGDSTDDSTPSEPVLPPITGDCPTFQNGTLAFGGLSDILMKAGAKADGAGSLLFYWHGTGSTATEIDFMIPEAAQQKILDAGGIIVSFESTTGTGTDCSGSGTFFEGDLAIADQIVACAIHDHAIDPHRIYATGCSAGAMFAACMGAERSNYMAAVAPNSGGFASFDGQDYVYPFQTPNPAHVPATMTMHGALGVDTIIIEFTDAAQLFDKVIKDAGGFAIDCDHGGDHCAAPPELYSAAIDFLLDHPYGVDPEPYASGLPAQFPKYCAR
jgi:predicted esterase